MSEFKLIAISDEGTLHDEAQRIELTLNSGFDLYHLRKKSFSIDDHRRILDGLAPEYLERVVVHTFYALMKEYSLLGFHMPFEEFSSRHQSGGTKTAPYSISVHSIEELVKVDGEVRNIWISPVYDSISKQGYRSNPALLTEMSGFNSHVIALGGIEPGNFGELQELGFSGAAMFGYLWKGDIQQNLKEAVKMREVSHA